MDRPTLKKCYNAAIAAAFGLGFALGYTLRNPNVAGDRLAVQQVRDVERDFPGCAKIYRRLLELFSQGEEVRADYDRLLEQVESAMAQRPDYVPFVALCAAIWEDWMCNVAAGRYDRATVARLAERVGLDRSASTETLVEELRARALRCWASVEQSPLVRDVERYGEKWRVLWEQHTNALGRTQVIRTPVDENGMADLARAFNVFALTRDFVRYPNNLSSWPEGFTFEEKHIADVLHCPQHPDVVFQLPCLAYLTPSRGGTIRRDLELFRTGMRIDGQKLDVEPLRAEHLHLLAFNTTRDRRIVRAQVRILYADGTEQVRAFDVPPWQQDKALLGDPLARRRLDPVHRDSEIHLANGSELNLPWSPYYMYHVAVELEPDRLVDEIYFPRHDPTTAGLEDAGINDVCIVALTIR